MSQTLQTSIATQNDLFRQSNIDGEIHISHLVSTLPTRDLLILRLMVAAFDNFTPDNDPYGEHDFGSVELHGERYYWKIDYYDLNCEYGSDDPSDSTVTRRIMTILHSSEY
jgi:Protein of unknown function (DUF3768)